LVFHSSTNKEIFRILRNPKLHHLVRKIPLIYFYPEPDKFIPRPPKLFPLRFVLIIHLSMPKLTK